MSTFTTKVQYGDLSVVIATDDFRELHQAAARVQELSADADYLRGRGAERVHLRYYVDKEGNDYFGFRDPDTGRNVTFGQYREKSSVPLFPKGEKGYFDGAEQKTDSSTERRQPAGGRQPNGARRARQHDASDYR